MYNTDCVDNQVQMLNEIFSKCLDLCAPIVTQEVMRPFSPWITDELKTLMLKKKKKKKKPENLEKRQKQHKLGSYLQKLKATSPKFDSPF